jgi:hypothetical protein
MFKKLFLILFLSIFVAFGCTSNTATVKDTETAVVKQQPKDPFYPADLEKVNKNKICTVQTHADALIFNTDIPIIVGGYGMYAVMLAEFTEPRNIILGPKIRQEALDALIEKYKSVIKNDKNHVEAEKKDALSRLSDGTWVNCYLATQIFVQNGRKMMMLIKEKDYVCATINK